VCSRLAEEFKFHLFEFSYTEDEVTRCDFVTERFTDLSDTEWQLAACCTLYVLKVYKYTLCCFGTKVGCRCATFRNTDKCLEHQVELSDGCKVTISAHGTADVVIRNVL